MIGQAYNIPTGRPYDDARLGEDMKVAVSNISVNVDRMDKLLAHQEELINVLEQKLSPFIRPYPVQSREETRTTGPSQSALAERLYHHIMRSETINIRINALIESIDL